MLGGSNRNASGAEFVGSQISPGCRSLCGGSGAGDDVELEHRSRATDAPSKIVREGSFIGGTVAPAASRLVSYAHRSTRLKRKVPAQTDRGGSHNPRGRFANVQRTCHERLNAFAR
jgi:hypothetical protein